MDDEALTSEIQVVKEQQQTYQAKVIKDLAQVTSRDIQQAGQ